MTALYYENGFDCLSIALHDLLDTLTEGGLLRTGLEALRAWSQQRSA